MERNVVYKATPQLKTFKACRTCRQQKSRCIVHAEPPCQRCRTIGRDCVFEELEPGRKRSRDTQHSPASEGASKKTRSDEGSSRQDELESEVAELRRTVARMQSSSRHQDHKDSRERPHSSDSPLDLPAAAHGGSVDWAKAVTSSEDLKLLRFGAPLAVVHSMIPGDTATTPSSVHTAQGSLPDSPFSGLATSDNPTSRHGKEYNDIISRGIISESKARNFFQSYMANANVFLPVFDSTVDTFETVRSRSNLLFTVVIAIASRLEEKQRKDSDVKQNECLDEARTLAGNSLFSNAHSLETVQALLLLSAYSEQNWFAISHTYKIAREIGLSNILPRQSSFSDERSSQTRPLLQNRRLAHAARTALLIHQVELEAATGTARPSKSLPVSTEFLREFISSKFSSTQDVRIAATIEIVQIRDHLLKDTEDQIKTNKGIMATLKLVEQDLNAWYKQWASIYQERDFILGSFQRSSLFLQRDYAFILISSNMISTIIKEKSSQTLSGVDDDDLGQLIEVTLTRIKELIQFIVDSQAYRWHLQWAPTYSAIFPVFVSALAYRLANLRPAAHDWRVFQSLISEIAEVLSRSPYRNFAVLLSAISKLPLRPTDFAAASRSRTMPSSPSAAEANHGFATNSTYSKDIQTNKQQEDASNNSDSIQNQPLESMHEQTSTPEGFEYYSQPDDGNNGFLNPLTTFHYPDNGINDDRGISSIFTGQDFMFDYRSFTASAQALLGGSDILDFSLADTSPTGLDEN